MKNRDYIFAHKSLPRCLMFGRTKISMSKSQIKNAEINDDISSEILTGYADSFLKRFGFDSVESLDYSNFEGANFICNLNKPFQDDNTTVLPYDFDFVMDYGTSEHIFNPPASFFNALTSLKEGGLFNCVLPVTGWCDHGFYQFSPAFFYALNNDKLSLVKLYFFDADPSADQLKYWDGLTSDFMEHIHGAFDGSFAANCLQYLNRPILAWALFRKNSCIQHDDFFFNTQQLVYKNQWNMNTNRQIINTNERKLDLYKKGSLNNNIFIEYINNIALYT